MSVDLHVYSEQFSDGLIPILTKRLNEYEMVVEVHPDFSFTNQAGFLPFKFLLTNSSFGILKDVPLISGFELYIDDFDLQTEKEDLNAEPSFFNKLLGKRKEEIPFASPEVEQRLKNCKKVANFNWHASDTFENRFALLTSAILTELTQGICYNPQDDLWCDSKDIVDNIYKEVKQIEQSLKEGELLFHEFEGW